VAVLAGGGSAALAVTSGRGPSELASSANARASGPLAAQTTSADRSVPSGKVLAPLPAPSAGWDMDGDGRPDTATIIPVVHLTRLGTQAVPFAATSQTGMPPRGPVIVGAADAAHDGHAELFVQVDAGCRLANGHLRQMTVSGAPVAFAVGGSILDNGGFSCAGPDLVVSFYNGAPADSSLADYRGVSCGSLPQYEMVR